MMTSFRSQTKNLARAALVLGVTMAASACGDEQEAAEPETAQEIVRSELPRLVDDSVEAFAFLDESQAWQRVGESTEHMEELFGEMPGTLPEVMIDEDHSGEALTRFLTERVFIPENYEGEGVYRLHGDDFCPEHVLTGRPNATCVERFDRAELRVEAFDVIDGLDVYLLVGPKRSEPLTIELREHSIAAVVDLAEAKDALLLVAGIAGVSVELPEVFEGLVAASLTRHGDRDVTFAASVRENVHIGGRWNGEPVELSTAAKDPILSVRAEGPAKRLTASADLGATRLVTPGHEVFELAGLTGTMTLADDAPAVRFTGVGLGDDTSTVSRDGTLLWAVDVNPSSGRRLDFSVSTTGSRPLIVLDPELEVLVESYQPDETYSFTVDGASLPMLELLPPSLLTRFAGAIRVINGELRLATTGAPQAVTVAAGDCLVVDPVTVGEHPVLGAFAALACP